MSIKPETKDWTWVLTQQCAECGENIGQLTVPDLITKLHELAPQWRQELGEVGVAQRPNSHTWSRLEYGAHVRDALAVFARRLELMLTQQAPTFADWDQDAAAVSGKYGESDPDLVAQQVGASIETTANLLAQLSPEKYARTGLRSDGASFTVQTLSQYFVHDVAHHLVDARRQR